MNIKKDGIVPNAGRLLWAGFMAILAAGIGFGIRGGILANWGAEFGFTAAQLGQIGGAGLTGFCFGIIIGGVICDKIGYGKLVIAAGSDADYGLFVRLRHPDGYETMYGHASRLLVRDGATVLAGQVIALSGSTGRCTAPHLHFEIRRGGRSVDPLSMVKEGS
jgi:MFS family permease